MRNEASSLRRTVKSWTTIKHPLARKFLAEFLGDFILLTIGLGSQAQLALSKDGHNDVFSVHWAWFLGVALGVWISVSVSGGHLNPAFSVAMSTLGYLPWLDCLVYMLAQYLSCFVASALVFGIYYEALNEFDGGTRQVYGEMASAGIFTTFPEPYVSWYGALLGSIYGTAMLLLMLIPLFDPNSTAKPPHGMGPFSFGLVVFALNLAYGMTSACILNPARDLSPRVFTLLAGWGVEVFSVRDYNYFWIPIVGPHIGSIIGAYVYVLLVGKHLEHAVKGRVIVADATKGEEDFKTISTIYVNTNSIVVHDEDLKADHIF